MRSTPGRCSSPAKPMPQSTRIHCRRRSRPEAVEGGVHADLAEAAERNEDKLVLGSTPSRCLEVSDQRRDAGCRRGGKIEIAGVDQFRCRRRCAAAGRPASIEALGTMPLRVARRQAAPSPVSPSPAARASHPARIARNAAGVVRASRARRRRARPTQRDSAANNASARASRRSARRGRWPDRRASLGAAATLTPKPITTAKPPPSGPMSFEQEAGDLGAVEEKVVRPFEREPRRREAGPAATASCSARPATKPSCGATAGSHGSTSSRLA